MHETSKFTLVQTTYLESFKLAECKYSLTLIGTFKTFVALEASLAGKTEVVEGSPYCPARGVRVREIRRHQQWDGSGSEIA